MPLDWKIFTQRPYIKSLPLEEQTRLFYIANEKSIRYRSRSGTGPTGPIYANPFSLNFDGTDDRVGGPDANLDSATTQGSWSTWINITEAPSGDVTFYARRGANNNHGELWGVNSSRKLIGNVGTGNATDGDYIGTTVLSTGTWHNVIHTYDGSGTGNDGRVKVYLNGTLETINWTGDVPANLLQSTGAGRAYSIGSATGTHRAFKGLIDEVAVWYGTTLTSENASAIYNGGVPTDLLSFAITPSFLYYKFNEGSGTTAIDATGNGNDGTINGATYSTSVPG